MERLFGYALALLLAGGAFFSGVQYGQDTTGSGLQASLFSLFAAEPEPTISTTNLEQFWEVWHLLEDKFAVSSSGQALTETEKIQGAIDGLVDAYGDPYTVYLPPAVTESFTDDISGAFSGVGMEVGMRNGFITIIAPLPETPAAQAGLVAGDIITAIDGESTEDMGLDGAVDRIRGEKGTTVTLTIYREGAQAFTEVPVVRDTIAIPTVQTSREGEVFIISLYSFNAVAEAQVRQALEEYQGSNATKLIVDVRGNPGGFLESAVGIASFFVPAGKVIVQESFVDASQDDVFRSRNRSQFTFAPDEVVVLVDGGSASASEILAGALQDHNRATVIGSQTFGKGSVQELIELDDGSSLKVTIARWLTPNGTSISAGGLAPDIVISRTPQQVVAGEDPQLAAALRHLAGETVASEVFTDSLLQASSTASGE